jgi:molybdate/tungstate transport system substrate-binding protein
MKEIAFALLLLPAAARAAETPKGEVSVLYAGSLVNLMEKDLGPAFEKASGWAYRGEGKGSVVLARMIKDKLREPDVFISADPKVNELLMGAANGDKVRWYGRAFRNEMVVGYNPKSRFAERFAKAAAGKLPIYEALQGDGLRLGRTDPKLDPKGYRTLFTFQLAEKFYRQPGLRKKILGADDNPDQVFPEEQLEARLETGQLDAGIFYRNEVEERVLPFVALPREINLGDPALEKRYATASYSDASGKSFKGGVIVYSITIPEGAPHRDAAISFVNFLLSDAGRSLLKKHGLAPVKPAFTGEAPAAVRAAP